MKLKAKVKMVSEKKEGISNSTGDKWEMISLLLEFVDEEGTQRILAHAFTEVTAAIQSQNIKEGDSVDAEVWFSVRTYRTGYSVTEAKLTSICLSA